MTVCHLASLVRFYLFPSFCGSTACCSTRLPPQKSYYISHIQVWTQNDGQSSLWSWGASKVSPTFSKKSVIHPVVEVLFFYIYFIFGMIYTLYLLCFVSSSVFSKWSLHTIRFLRYYHRITNQGKPCFETICSAVTTQIYFFCHCFWEYSLCIFHLEISLFIMFFSII